MLKSLTALLLVLTLVSASSAALLGTDKPEIIIAGKGIIKAAADVAYIMIGVERTEATATQAQKVVAKKMNNVLSSLRKMGIAKDKIETSRINLSPKYKYDRGQRTLVGYTANNEIKVTIDKLENLGKIIDTSISAGATNVNRVRFTIKDEAPLKRAALQLAVKDAKAKAEIIATTAGLVLSKIKSIQEAAARVITPVNRTMAFKAEGVGAGGATPISPGKVEVRGNLTVVYECNIKK